MSGLQWYPHYPGDYARDTQQLSLLEHGAYRLLMDHYYSTGSLACCINRSTNDETIDDSSVNQSKNNLRMYRLCRAISEEEREAVDNVLKMFFTYKNGAYLNKKVEQVIAHQAEKYRKLSEAGKKAAAKKKEKKAKENSINRLTNDATIDRTNDITIDGSLVPKPLNDRSTNQNQNILDKSNIIKKTKAKKDFEEQFQEFWSFYIPVETSSGSSPAKGAKKPSKEKFNLILNNSKEPEQTFKEIMLGLQNYLKHCMQNNQFSKSAPKFLNDRAWEDYQEIDSRKIVANQSASCETAAQRRDRESDDAILAYANAE